MEPNFDPTVENRLKNLRNMIVDLVHEFNKAAEDCEFRAKEIEGIGCICKLEERWTTTCSPLHCVLESTDITTA